MEMIEIQLQLINNLVVMMGLSAIVFTVWVAGFTLYREWKKKH